MCALPPTVLAQRPRATALRRGTETQSRDSLHSVFSEVGGSEISIIIAALIVLDVFQRTAQAQRPSAPDASIATSGSRLSVAGPFILTIIGLMRTIYLMLVALVIAVPAFGQERSFTVATLNCYRFFNGEEGKGSIDKPRSNLEYSKKAGHLIGLLPREAPLFVGFQEIGGGEDLAGLAKSAAARYGRRYQTLFAHGKDTSTGQNVGAILDTTSGFGVYGRPSRVSELERELSKHLVVS